eukprot:9421179-Prorocentrum_lima.AAC.1
MAILNDVMVELEQKGVNRESGWLPGVQFDSILYADDTSLVSGSSGIIQAILVAIQDLGLQYGMALNQDKCEMLRFHSLLDIFFKDGTKVKVVEQAKLLGCYLNCW